MDNEWLFKPQEEILQGVKEEGISFFDFSVIEGKDMRQFEKTLQEIEQKARNDEAAAIAKASSMRLSL